MQTSNQHIVAHHYFRTKHTELNQIYAVMSMRSFFLALIVIFIPIYFLKIGFSAEQIFLYYTLVYLFEAILEYAATLFLVRFGPKHNIAISMPLLIFHLSLLWTLPLYNWPLWLVAFTASISLAFFWQGYHFDFSKAKHSKSAAKEISKMYIVIAILGAIAPFLGGVIATNFGIGYLYAFVVLGLLISIIPLIKTKEPHVRKSIDYKRLNFRNLMKDQFSYGGAAVETSTAMVIWPLFIYAVVGTYQKVGAITSIALIGTVFITYIAGKRADKISKRRYIKRGSYLSGLVNFAKSLSSSAFHILFLNIITSIAHALYTSPWFAEYYLHADKEGRAEYISYMEFSADIFRAVFFFSLYLLSFVFVLNDLLVAGLIIGGFFSFLIALMPAAKLEKKNEIKVS